MKIIEMKIIEKFVRPKSATDGASATLTLVAAEGVTVDEAGSGTLLLNADDQIQEGFHADLERASARMITMASDARREHREGKTRKLP